MSTWYRQGTISVTNGNATVTGIGTAWGAANTHPGDVLLAPDGKLYEILSIDSVTQLTIKPTFSNQTGYQGTTDTSGNAKYAIAPLVGSTTTADLAQRISAILTAWQDRQDELSDWQGGTVTGGDGNGYYPLTDSLGAVTHVMCPAKITSIVGNLDTELTAAQGYATSAQSSATSAQTYASQAGTSATNADNSASAANTSATNASNSATSASSSASTATTKANEASSSASSASSSASSAATSATNAANSASAAAASAASAASALSIDTSNFVDKTTTQTITGAKTFGSLSYTGTLTGGTAAINELLVNTSTSDGINKLQVNGNVVGTSFNGITGLSTIEPSINGTASVGVSTMAATADHTHPSNVVTFNNAGTGAASGATFNGAAAVTISYNTVGAASSTGVGATGTWPISISGYAASAGVVSDASVTPAKLSAGAPSWDTSSNTTVAGNLNLTGTGKRITGDFSNSTIANRVMFQTSIANEVTYIQTIPNGTSTNAGFTAFTSSDANNSSFADMSCNGAESRLRSDTTGTGTYLPMTFYTGGSQRLNLATDGTFTSISGAIGYGTGAGGTVTQATSKTTAVTLNKPCGQITMNNAALAALATVYFTLNNSLIGAADLIHTNTYGNLFHRVAVQNMGVGSVRLAVTNTDTISHSEAVVINFAIIKGAIS